MDATNLSNLKYDPTKQSQYIVKLYWENGQVDQADFANETKAREYLAHSDSAIKHWEILKVEKVAGV